MVIFCEATGFSWGDMPVIPQHELQRVFARRQRQVGFGLTRAEVLDVVGHGQRRVEVGRRGQSTSR